jgi:hypothetical protein
MSRGMAFLTSILAFLVSFAAMAISATACEGGGGGPELTALATKLSGESKEGEEITVLEGAKVKDKATLTGKSASKATGKVAYKVYSNKECKTLVTSAGEVTVSGESVPASSEEALEGGKTYYWQAHYGGDSNNAESTSPCTEILNVKAKTTITTTLSDEGKEGDELEVMEGATLTDKASLSGSDASMATGTVTYKVYSNPECTEVAAEAGKVEIAGASAPASSGEDLPTDTYYWQAIYSGDKLNQSSTSACGSEISFVGVPLTVSALNSGGPQTPNTNKCEFKLKLEPCSITVQNLSPVPVEIVSVEITGAGGLNERYGATLGECTIGKRLQEEPPKGGTCVGSAQAIAEPPLGQEWNSNAYTVEVRQTANHRNRLAVHVLLSIK